MPNAARLGDLGSPHDACPAHPIVEASSNVFTNSKGAARMGDALAVHSCPAHPPHSGNIASGSSTVFINGKKAARLNDPISCGGAVAQGSQNVFIGG